MSLGSILSAKQRLQGDFRAFLSAAAWQLNQSRVTA